MDTHRRIFYAILTLLITFTLALLWQVYVGWTDLGLPLCSTRQFLLGENPYHACTIEYLGKPAASYPLTTFLAFAPFALLPDKIGIALIWAIANALMVYGVLKRGERWRLLIFTSAAYWYAFGWQQFSVLMTAIMLLPALFPLALVKPQLGLPIMLTRTTRRGALAASTFGVLTLVIYPTWPLDWFGQARHYDGAIPLFLLPFGPLLLLALLRWRDGNARFLLLMAAMPQRGIYDLTPLWLLPKTPRQMLMLSASSWIGFAGAVVIGIHDNTQVARLTSLGVAFVYLPALLFLLKPLLVAIFTPAATNAQARRRGAPDPASSPHAPARCPLALSFAMQYRTACRATPVRMRRRLHKVNTSRR